MRAWGAVIALSLCGCPKAPPPSALPEGALRLDWPDGAVAERTAERFSRRDVGGQRRERVVVASETVSVARDASGWTLRVTDGRFRGIDGEPVEPVLAALAAVPQEVKIDAGGAFQGLVAPNRWADEARAAMQAVVDPRDVLAQIKVDLAVQPDRLDDTLAREWRSMVGFWVGRSAATGSVGTVPGFDARGDPAPGSAALAVEGVARCGAESCLRLVARSDVDPAELARRGEAVLKAWVEAVDPAPVRSGVEGLQGEVVAAVLVDPLTLLPRQYEVAEVVSGTVRVDDQAMPFRNEEGKTVRWTWTLPGGDP